MKTPTTEQIETAIGFLETALKSSPAPEEQNDYDTKVINYLKTSLFALQFLKLAMGEPSVEVIKVGVLAACPSIVGGGDYYPFKSYEVPYSFKAMRDKLLEKAGE